MATVLVRPAEHLDFGVVAEACEIFGTRFRRLTDGEELYLPLLDGRVDAPRGANLSYAPSEHVARYDCPDDQLDEVYRNIERFWGDVEVAHMVDRDTPLAVAGYQPQRLDRWDIYVYGETLPVNVHGYANRYRPASVGSV